MPQQRSPHMSEIAKHWIDGEWTGSGTVSESVNPATGAVLGEWADGGEAEARAAIAAARRAFGTSPWSRDRSLRHRALSEMAYRFDAHAEELGVLVTKENGKKIAEGMFEGGSPGPTLRHTAGQALTDTGISAEVARGRRPVVAEPAGPRCRQQRGSPGRHLRLAQRRERRAEQDHAVGRHLTRPAGVPRQSRPGLHPLGNPGVQRDHDVRLQRERGRVRRLPLQVELAGQSGELTVLDPGEGR